MAILIMYLCVSKQKKGRTGGKKFVNIDDKALMSGVTTDLDTIGESQKDHIN